MGTSLKRWLERAWWKLRYKHIAGTQTDVQTGESVYLVAPASLIDEHTQLVARWTCTRCGKNYRKIVNALEAGQFGMEIACPVCDPNEIASRDVTTD